ncbi:MAG: chemotaxis protein CheC [Haloarculaceae archaeon]
MDVDTDAFETVNPLTREGAQAASDALGEMLDAETRVDVTRVTVADRRDVRADLRRATGGGVRFEIEGALAGTLLFAFERSCVETVTQRLVPDGADESLARSSVTELANVMMGGFLAGWGDHLGTGLDASPPTFVAPEELADVDIEAVGLHTDSVLAFRTSVRWGDDAVGVDIHLFPERDGMEAILDPETDAGAERSLADVIAAADADAAAFGLAEEGAEDEGEAAGDWDDWADDGAFDVDEPGDGDAGETTGSDEVTASFGLGDDGDAETVSLEKLSAFSDLTREGTAAAADRVTAMAGVETTTAVAGINFTPIEDISGGLVATDAVGVTCEIEGTPSGHVVIAFARDAAIDAAERMLPVDPDGEGLTEMHRSAIEELGNVMTSGFVDGWANVLETTVEHSPPAYVDDVELAVLEIVTGELGPFQTHAFSIEAEIRGADDFACRVLTFPHESALGEALDALSLDRRDRTDVDPDDLF